MKQIVHEILTIISDYLKAIIEERKRIDRLYMKAVLKDKDE